MDDSIALLRGDYREPRRPSAASERNGAEPVPLLRVLTRLDEYLGKNDYESASVHLRYWLNEARRGNDKRSEYSLSNEQMGLCRKTGRKADAIAAADHTLVLCSELGYENTVAGGTGFVNAATVYAAFGDAEKALSLFSRAVPVYEKELENSDSRLGSLYNNMALALIDLERYDEAYSYYDKALEVMGRRKDGALEQAITYLNIANALEDQLGMEQCIERIEECISKAKELLEDSELPRNGYYAFVCEKCAPTFDYYGEFMYAAELVARAEAIYKNN